MSEKIAFTKQTFQEFQRNPQEFCKKNNIEVKEFDQNFMKNCKSLSFEECKEQLKHSRFGGFFDFSTF